MKDGKVQPAGGKVPLFDRISAAMANLANFVQAASEGSNKFGEVRFEALISS